MSHLSVQTKLETVSSNLHFLARCLSKDSDNFIYRYRLYKSGNIAMKISAGDHRISAEYWELFGIRGDVHLCPHYGSVCLRIGITPQLLV
jgi:hypothetical protein